MVYLAEYFPKSKLENREQEHKIGRALLHHALQNEYGISQEISIAPGGKPFFQNRKDLFFNISHTEGMVVCVLDNAEVGIDVEKISSNDEPTEALMRKICTTQEVEFINAAKVRCLEKRAFFQLWTLKESFVKAIGEGLSYPFKDISFQREELEKLMFSGKKITGSVDGWYFEQVQSGPQYVVSICGKKEEKYYDIRRGICTGEGISWKDRCE